ncbi:hypothetical protein PSYAC_24273, partial [Pseudomonas syringae pv. actinidiae str. M302091]
PEVVELLERTAKRVSGATGHSTALKLLECYCDLQNAQVTYLDLSSPKYLDLVRGLMGALMSDDFVEMHAASRRAYARLVAVIHQALCIEIPAMERVEHGSASMALCDAIWQEHRSKLCSVSTQYWNGWVIESSKGQNFYLALTGIWTSHGQEFTEDYFLQWKLFFKKQARPVSSSLRLIVSRRTPLAL